MKTIRLFILPICFSVIACYVFLQGISYYKKASDFKISSFCEQLTQERFKTLSVNSGSIPTIKNLMEALLLRHKLPLNVTISTEKKALRVDNPDKTQGSAYRILNEQRYNALLTFLSDLSELPYPLAFDKMCIGPDCPGGVEIEMKVQ